jgi:hypothetical protein
LETVRTPANIYHLKRRLILEDPNLHQHRCEKLKILPNIYLYYLRYSTTSTTSKEWTTPDCRNTPSPTNLGEKGIVDDPGKDGNASTPEQVKRPNTWKKMMMMMTLLSSERVSIYGYMHVFIR